MGYYLATERRKILPFLTTWMDLENTVLIKLYIPVIESQIHYDLSSVWKLRKSKLLLWGLVVEKVRKWWSKCTNLCYKMSKFVDLIGSLITIANNSGLCSWNLLRDLLNCYYTHAHTHTHIHSSYVRYHMLFNLTVVIIPNVYCIKSSFCTHLLMISVRNNSNIWNFVNHFSKLKEIKSVKHYFCQYRIEPQR